MRRIVRYTMLSLGALLLAVGGMSCSSVQEQAKSSAPAVVKKAAKTTNETAKKSSKKAVEVEGVLSSVGQRTITFQVERKGRVREEVVGIDEKTQIEKNGSRVKLADLNASDKVLIAYEPEAYTPALAIKVVGVGKVQKIGGDD